MTEHRIVVGVDGSDASFDALGWAAREAGRRGVALHIVVCFQVPVVTGAGYLPYVVEPDIAIVRDANDKILADALAVARRAAPGVHVDGEVAPGYPATLLTERAGTDALLVVGTSGHGGASLFLGSTATAVIHKAHRPVVVVPGRDIITPPTDETLAPTATQNAAGATHLEQIVVGVDESPAADDALDWAAAEAEMRGASLVVLHAWTYPYEGWRTGVAEPRDEMKLDAARVLDAAVHRVQAAHPLVVVHARLVEDGPTDALVDASAAADLVVVGTRGRGGFRASLLGSVSRSVIFHASCPVAVIPHPKSQAREAAA
jgi:nucleotide-binding universal stress UspA family protein